MGLEPMTSSLPRKCSTTELQQLAGKRVKGIEPSYSAWKAAALPLSYTRFSTVESQAQMTESSVSCDHLDSTNGGDCHLSTGRSQLKQILLRATLWQADVRSGQHNIPNSLPPWQRIANGRCRIRTCETEVTDLQSVPFNHSGNLPHVPEIDAQA